MKLAGRFEINEARNVAEEWLNKGARDSFGERHEGLIKSAIMEFVLNQVGLTSLEHRTPRKCKKCGGEMEVKKEWDGPKFTDHIPFCPSPPSFVFKTHVCKECGEKEIFKKR